MNRSSLKISKETLPYLLLPTSPSSAPHLRPGGLGAGAMASCQDHSLSGCDSPLQQTLWSLYNSIQQIFCHLWSCKKFFKQKHNFFLLASLSEYLLPATDKKHFLTQCSFRSNRASPSFVNYFYLPRRHLLTIHPKKMQ